MASDAGGSTVGEETSLAAAVRRWRERALLTQEELADHTGLGVRTIRRLESGELRRPRSRSLQLLADALRLTDDELSLLAALGRVPPPPPPSPPTGRRTAVPRQVPADVTGFTGRGDHLRELDKLVDAGAVGAVMISAIAGTAGVGKTALAVHWAHRVARRFPDGQLYVNLRGFDPGGAPTDPATAVRGFLHALEVSPRRVPAGLDEQAALYRSLLAGRRMLVLLDNARDADQVRPLLPGSPGCLAVVTSRDKLIGLIAESGAYPLTVDLLPHDEARHLLERRIGGRVVAEPEAVDEIIAACARLPLALAVVAARAAAQPGARSELATVAAELRDIRHRLDAYATGDAMTDLRAVFQWSYRSLAEPAAAMFRLLGVDPGPDIGVPAAASLAAVSPGQARRLLDELARAHLVAEQGAGRYHLHDLLRAYAAELAETIDGAAGADAARVRLLDHYLQTGHAAACVLHPLRVRFVPDPAAAGVTPEPLADQESARTWFDLEHRSVISAVHLAGDRGHDVHAYQLAWCLTDYLDWRGRWHDWAAVQQVAIRSARRLGDPAAQSLAHRGMAGAHVRRGDYDGAYAHLRQALEVTGDSADLTERGQANVNLGSVSARLGRHDDALAHGKEALALYRAAGHRVGQGDALLTIGEAYGRLGDHERSVAYLREALAVARELDNSEGVAAALDSLGAAYQGAGDDARAVACYEEAVALCRALGQRYYEAYGLHHLGDAHDTAGDHPAARRAWQAALDILTDLDHPESDEVRRKLAGR